MRNFRYVHKLSMLSILCWKNSCVNVLHIDVFLSLGYEFVDVNMSCLGIANKDLVGGGSISISTQVDHEAYKREAWTSTTTGMGQAACVIQSCRAVYCFFKCLLFFYTWLMEMAW